MFRFRLLIAVLGTMCWSMLSGQSLFIQTKLRLTPETSVYKISETPIINHSEIIHADSLLLLPGLHYRLDYHKGELTLLTIPDSNILSVEYILLPPELAVKHQTWELRNPSDSLSFSTAPPRTYNWGSDSKLDIRGSKTFAIAFSNDQSVDLKQSLYVNLSGELAPGVNITAQLSDSQSKLSPEGDSKELSSLDQVFVKVGSDKFELAMGDLEWNYEGTRYINYYSKFAGLNAWYSGKQFIQAAYCAGGGKSTSLLLSIIDGKQGPYYLRANEYQPGFIVVAGSEEVYVDGSKWERGSDYAIDYSQGSIMFKRLVSSTNSVMVRFQYTDEFYSQTGYLLSSRTAVNSRISLSQHLIWQQDDKSHPLLYTFTDADHTALEAAGDSLAWGAGVTEVEAGTGDYKALQLSGGTVYYEYAPGDSLANYQIVFSYVGSGKGDYEEFSPGKYKYRGEGLGSWLPLKRLIAPAQKGNLDLNLSYAGELLNANIEALGSLHDKNTLSPKDDSDNLSGIIYAQTTLSLPLLSVKLEHETRARKSMLFGDYRKLESEYDFAALPAADSLAQNQTDLSMGFNRASWRQTLLFRLKDIAGLYRQKAVRFSSSTPAQGLIPALTLQSTISKQDYNDSLNTTGWLQYHLADAGWQWKWLKVRNKYLYNLFEHGEEGSINQRITPSLELGNQARLLSQLSYSLDTANQKFVNWRMVNESQTYALRQVWAGKQNHLDMDITHRQVKQPLNTSNPRTAYDLINLRSNHNVLKQAVAISTNYSLNQTEFFAKIRELQYIGNGLGLYDSTGVAVPDGDYDYVYITGEQGTLSTETSALISLFFKPAMLSKAPFFQRWQNDLSAVLNEQSTRHNDWQSYLFLPGYVFKPNRTIYGKQSVQHNLWLDLMRNHINANLQLGAERSLDQRYQTAERSYSITRALQLDIKGFGAYNTRMIGQWDTDEDSHYANRITQRSFSLNTQRSFTPQSSVQTELKAMREDGGKQGGSENYHLSSLAFSPGLRSVWMQKYRITATASFAYNWLSGSNYFSFLPQKREGFVPSLNLSSVYRLNTYSSLTLDYRFWDYPQDKARHELKLEFKAEL